MLRLIVKIVVVIIVVGLVLTGVFLLLTSSSCQPGNTPPTPPTPTAQIAPYATPAVAQGNCPDGKAIRTEPQGVLQGDGSFIAQLGNTGCVSLFEGRIWEQGKPIQPRHDIVLIRGAKDGFRLWEGNGWILPVNWDANQIACSLWAGKQQNWISQGIVPLPVRFWGFDPLPSCQAAALSASTPTVVVSATASVSSTQPAQTAVPATPDWTKVLGVPADRLEACPGEAQDKCVHLKDGALVSVQIPVGFRYEGWDGSQVVMGNGPAMVKVSGLTVRPR